MNTTKGKWEAVENEYYVDIMCNGLPIASAHSNQFSNTSKEQMQANARMMAASKEMAAMLVTLSDLMPFLDEQTHPQIECDALKFNIDELLAKVKGEL